MSDTTTDDSPRCPHCGSDKGTWFSRTEPMGDICEECGENVDEPPKISATKRWLTEDEQYVYEAMLTIARQHADAVLVRDAIKMIDRLCSELDKQQEVIDKLPKCWRLDDNGELVQDVPVTLGMNIYVESAGRVVGCGYISMREPDSTCGDIWGTVRTEDGAEFGVPVYLTYATKEAAAARAGEGRG